MRVVDPYPVAVEKEGLMLQVSAVKSAAGMLQTEPRKQVNLSARETNFSLNHATDINR